MKFFLKKINKNYVLKIFFLIIYLVPVNGAYALNGLPINNKVDLVLLLVLLIPLKKSKNKNILFFIIIFFLFKIFISFVNNNMWTVCVNDDLTPSQNTFEYEYFNSRCSKSFDTFFYNSKYDSVYPKVSYSKAIYTAIALPIFQTKA